MIPALASWQVELRNGPQVSRPKNALLAAYVFVDIRDRDVGSYVGTRKSRERRSVSAGLLCHLVRPVRYMERAKAKLAVVVPLTLAIIFVLLYLNFRRLTETVIVMLSVPLCLVGGVWLMVAGLNMSVAVAVGFIALAGVAAETGVVMLIYLDQAWQELRQRRQTEGVVPSAADLYHAIMEGAVERVRPKMMTVVAIMAGPTAHHVEQWHLVPR